jgi:uncharacterized OB-fold protein
MTTGESDRSIEPYAEGLREAANRGTLAMQRCDSCGAVQLYPRRRCVTCGSDRLEYVPVSGRGTVYTFSTIYRNPPSDFIDDVPYTLAIVKLEEGARLLTRLVECVPDEVRCDMAVRSVYPLREGSPLPYFRPIEESA